MLVYPGSQPGGMAVGKMQIFDINQEERNAA
jgi:hypothetical protein